MAASEVEICNMALAQIRAGSINSLNEASVEGEQCNLHYDIARDQVLSDFDWGFNNRVAALAQLSSTSVFGWAYTWGIPSDCLHINFLRRNYNDAAIASSGDSAVAMRADPSPGSARPSDIPEVEYGIYYDNDLATKIIATQEGTIRADYRARVQDPTLYSIDFRIALSYLIASFVAVPIAGQERGQELQKTTLALYDAFIAKAKEKSGNQRSRTPMESDYIAVRQQG